MDRYKWKRSKTHQQFLVIQPLSHLRLVSITLYLDARDSAQKVSAEGLHWLCVQNAPTGLTSVPFLPTSTKKFHSWPLLISGNDQVSFYRRESSCGPLFSFHILTSSPIVTCSPLIDTQPLFIERVNCNHVLTLVY